MRGRPVPPGRRSQGNSAVSRSVSGASMSSNASGSSVPLSRSPLGRTSALSSDEDERGSGEGDDAHRVSSNDQPSSVLESGSDTTSSAAAPGLGLSLQGDDYDDISGHRADGGGIPLEAVENALQSLSRDDLVLALKRAKEQMDILDSRVETLTERNESLQETANGLSTQLNSLEGDHSGLGFALSHREERIDELMREQERLEEDLYLRADVNERLRKQLNESERARSDAERRYTEQTATIDRERQYYLDQEKLLLTQKSKASAAYDRTHSANQELARENERLQHQVTQLRASSPMRRVPSPMADRAPSQIDEDGTGGNSDAAAAADENGLASRPGASTLAPTPSSHVAQSLMDESTSSELDSLRAEHAALQASHNSLTDTMQQLQTELRDTRVSNADLRQQNQMFVDILQEKTINGDLVAGSAVLNRRYSRASSEASSEAGTDTTETSNTDDVPDVPRADKPAKSSSSKRLVAKSSSDRVDAIPLNLANELEQSEPTSEGRERRKQERKERSEALSTDVETLQREVLDLRDANQALTLYVNKILDRILAREGYENVLAIDSERRTLRGKPSRMHLKSMRPSTIPSSSPEKTVVQRDPTESRHGVPPLPADAAPETPTTFTERARRTASLDWRSFIPNVGMPATPSTPQARETAALGSARRIQPNEEIEDKHDEQERERIRQNLLRQGIVLPDHQLRAQKRQSTSIGTFFSRVIGTPKRDAATSPVEQPVTAQIDSASGSTQDSASQMGESSGGGAQSVASSSPINTRDLRQRALEAGSPSGNLTDIPERKDRRLNRRSTSRGDFGAITTSPSLGHLATSPDELSRGPSEAGDESYGYVGEKSPERATPTLDSEAADEPGWRKALKRMSLLSATTPNTAGASIRPSDASEASPSLEPRKNADTVSPLPPS